jgi:hypothetical protein
MISRLVLACLFLPVLVTQPLPEEDALRLERIRGAIRRHLTAMPNYTCLETVERFEKVPGSVQESLIDVLRLEVAYVAGREMFAWPGTTYFETNERRELVPTGAFSTGGFALHARAIFLGNETIFRGVGEENVGGVDAWRFDYDAPGFRSRYRIQNPANGQAAEVGYHGSVLVRKDNLELLRISIEADAIPAVLEIAQASDRLDYQVVRLAGGDVLLPLAGEVRITHKNGDVAMNRTRLSNCRQYLGESSIRFGNFGGEGAAATGKRELEFDPNVELELALEGDVQHGANAVGDEIRATLKRDVKMGNGSIARKGSVATGRIVRLAHRGGEDSSYSVTLEFDALEGDYWRAKLRLRLVRTEPFIRVPMFDRYGKKLRLPAPDANGFLVYSRQLKLPRGFTTIWQTQK